MLHKQSVPLPQVHAFSIPRRWQEPGFGQLSRSQRVVPLSARPMLHISLLSGTAVATMPVEGLSAVRALKQPCKSELQSTR